MTDVQVFGTRNHAGTRKALRFFKERRVRVHFVDLATRGASPRELDRFARRHGVGALVDRDSKRFRSLGLHAAHYSDDRWLELLATEPLILIQPLVRCGGKVTVGVEGEVWKGWLV